MMQRCSRFVALLLVTGMLCDPAAVSAASLNSPHSSAVTAESTQVIFRREALAANPTNFLRHFLPKGAPAVGLILVLSGPTLGYARTPPRSDSSKITADRTGQFQTPVVNAKDLKQTLKTKHARTIRNIDQAVEMAEIFAHLEQWRRGPGASSIPNWIKPEHAEFHNSYQFLKDLQIDLLPTLKSPNFVRVHYSVDDESILIFEGPLKKDNGIKTYYAPRSGPMMLLLAKHPHPANPLLKTIEFIAGDVLWEIPQTASRSNHADQFEAGFAAFPMWQIRWGGEKNRRNFKVDEEASLQVGPQNPSNDWISQLGVLPGLRRNGATLKRLLPLLVLCVAGATLAYVASSFVASDELRHSGRLLAALPLGLPLRGRVKPRFFEKFYQAA